MSQEILREHIELLKVMFEYHDPQPQPLTEDVQQSEPVLPPIINAELDEKLTNLIFKLRSYQDPEIGEYSAGVEAGMNRAADMLQNLINRLKEE